MDGKADQPVILGALYQSKYNPVTRDNPTEHMIKTKSNTLIMNDHPNKHDLLLMTEKEENQYQMTPEAMILRSNTGNMQLSAQGGTYHAQKNIHITSNESAQFTAQRMTLASDNEHIQFQATKNIDIRANKQVSMNIEHDFTINIQGNTTYRSEINHTVLSQHNISISATQGSMSIVSHDKHIALRANEGPFVLSTHHSTLTITKNNEIVIDAPSITITSPVINMRHARTTVFKD
jgi:uncharacterized protein (DUF2345 family)